MLEETSQLDLVTTLLRTESTLALATADESGGASIAPLFYIADEALALYWISSGTTVHSRNLERDSRASITIYHSTEHWEEIRGVQMRGCAIPVRDEEHRESVIDLYVNRFHLEASFREAIAQSTLYKFCPEFLRYIDNAKGFGYKFELMPGSDAQGTPCK
ncbi:MAG TPA: pyridoxamine 5'-phosphate oxidase family protein [Acidisarcina sp.]|nr:pyridoxamine 5'-phosphate oxidase family protein [Acidisarcina sp.]